MKHQHHEAATMGLIEWTICVSPIVVATVQSIRRRKKARAK